MSSPGVVTFDPPVASIPFKNIIIRIAPSGTPSPCKACHRLHPSSVRKTRKVAGHHDWLVCRQAAQLVPPSTLILRPERSFDGGLSAIFFPGCLPFPFRGPEPPKRITRRPLHARPLTSYLNAQATTIPTNRLTLGVCRRVAPHRVSFPSKVAITVFTGMTGRIRPCGPIQTDPLPACGIRGAAYRGGATTAPAPGPRGKRRPGQGAVGSDTRRARMKLL
jgi:hypothetical protein